MKNLLTYPLSLILLTALLGGAAVTGCRASGSLNTATPAPEPTPTPPPPEPTPPPPNPDPDADGIQGEADKCPDKAETKNGYQDDDGCPDTLPPVYIDTQRNMIVHDEIKFEKGSARIDHASDKLLEEIAKVMKEHPDMQFFEIAGHTDVDGAEGANVQLSKDRATSVMKELIKDGVDAKRLRAVGYGPYCLVDKGTTEEAHQKNRRVDFVILRQGGKDLSPAWDGCPEAEAKKMKPQPIPASAPKLPCRQGAIARSRHARLRSSRRRIANRASGVSVVQRGSLARHRREGGRYGRVRRWTWPKRCENWPPWPARTTNMRRPPRRARPAASSARAR